MWSCTGLEYVQALVSYGSSNSFLLASSSNDGLTGHQLLDDVLDTPGHDQHHLQQCLLELAVSHLWCIGEEGGDGQHDHHHDHHVALYA